MSTEVAVSEPEHQAICNRIKTRSGACLRYARSSERAELCKPCGWCTGDEIESRIRRCSEDSMEMKYPVTSCTWPLHKRCRCTNWRQSRSIKIRGKVSLFQCAARNTRRAER